MLQKKEILRLMMMYCGPVPVISGFGTLSAGGVLLMVGNKALIPSLYIVTLLKILMLGVLLLCFKIMSSGNLDYFYINVGWHPRKLLRLAVCIDSVTYTLVCILILLFRYVFNF